MSAMPANAGKTITVVEVRRGKGPKPPFRVVGTTTTSPDDAVRQMCDAVGIRIKEIRRFGDDEYRYGVPVLDGLATQVRARTYPVTQVAQMVMNTMNLV